MDPYGTFGSAKSIPYKPTAAMPVPSTQPPRQQASGYGYLDPTVNPVAPMSYKNPSEATDYTGSLSIMEQAIKSYESIPSARPSGQQQVQVSVTGEEAPESADSWRHQLYADRAASANRSGYSGGGSATSVAPNRAPYEAMKAPELPEFKGTAYAPPEEDKGVYGKKRREAMGAGMRELREGTREAISSSQSLDNPNARGKFIQQALKGYGQGLEKVAAGASREATSEANRARAEQLDTYKIQHSIKSNTYLQNYQNKINTIAADFASQQSAQMMNWEESGNQEGEPVVLDPRSKSSYYNSNNPNMGYFA